MRKLLAAVLGLFCLANIARAILAVQQAVQLPDVPTALPPGYLVAISVAWAVVFGACAYGIVRSHGWGGRVTIAAILLYQANLWLNRLMFTRSAETADSTGFAALLSALSIVFIAGAAWWCQRSNAQTRLPAPVTTHES